jgi:hypothetical protein
VPVFSETLYFDGNFLRTFLSEFLVLQKNPIFGHPFMAGNSLL